MMGVSLGGYLLLFPMSGKARINYWGRGEKRKDAKSINWHDLYGWKKIASLVGNVTLLQKPYKEIFGCISRVTPDSPSYLY